MTTPLLSSLAAILYFGWLWHNRSAVEQRNGLTSAKVATKAEDQETVERRLLRRTKANSQVHCQRKELRPQVQGVIARHGGCGGPRARVLATAGTEPLQPPSLRLCQSSRLSSS